MGCGEEDDSFFIEEDIQPDSMNTTDLISQMTDDISFVFHIGDMSYARGFSAVYFVQSYPSYSLFVPMKESAIW